MRNLVSLLLSIAVVATVYAQDEYHIEVVRPDYVVVATPHTRHTIHQLVIVDTSLSMGGLRYLRAIEAVLDFTAQGNDEFRFSVIKYRDQPERFLFEGQPWVEMPNRDAYAGLLMWLATDTPSGGTSLWPALRDALADPEPDLTIWVVSDGSWHEDDWAEVVNNVPGAQEARETPAIIAGCGVGGRHTQGRFLQLQAMGRDGGLLWNVNTVRKPTR